MRWALGYSMILTLKHCLNKGGMLWIMKIYWSYNIWKQFIFLRVIFWQLQLVTVQIIIGETFCKLMHMFSKNGVYNGHLIRIWEENWLSYQHGHKSWSLEPLKSDIMFVSELGSHTSWYSMLECSFI